MKHLIALLLISSILVFLVACTGELSPDSPQDTTTQTSQKLEETTEEIEQAISYGLVPEEIQGDYNTGITFRTKP